MKGEWIDFNNKTYEIVAETPADVVCREVMLMSEKPVLFYGEKTIISKKMIEEAMNSIEIIADAVEKTCDKFCVYKDTVDDKSFCRYMRDNNGACYLDELLALTNKECPERKLIQIETAIRFCDDVQKLSSEEEQKCAAKEVAYEHIRRIVKGE